MFIKFDRWSDNKSLMFKTAHAIARITAKEAGSYAMALQSTIKDLNLPCNRWEITTVQNIGNYFVISNTDEPNGWTIHRIYLNNKMIGRVKCSMHSAVTEISDIIALYESAKEGITEHTFKYNNLDFLTDTEYQFFEGNGITGQIF